MNMTFLSAVNPVKSARLALALSLVLAGSSVAPRLQADEAAAKITHAGKVSLQDGVMIMHNVPYKTAGTDAAELDAYEKERCVADLYLPADKKDFPLVVWFHGGGLTAGDKANDGTPQVAKFWAQEGIGVMVANYRLSPKVKYPTYLQDGAAAVAWAKQNMPAADRSRIFVGGHSAGAYMAMMIGMDAKRLEEAGLKQADIAGLIPVSGQTMTHFTIRQEQGLPKERTIVDDAAPVFLAGKNVLPMLLLVGDNDMKTRWEENAYFAAQCRALGAEHVQLLMIKDRNHGTIFKALNQADDLGYQAVKAFIANPLQSPAAQP